MIELVISGGQSGADLAGNEFARTVGIQTLCYIFHGFVPINVEDDALLTSFPRKCIVVSDPTNYVRCLTERTAFNVKKADATVIFVERAIEQTRGSRLTAKLCEAYGKAYYVADVRSPDCTNGLRRFLADVKPSCMNVAGERTLRRHRVVDVLLGATDA